MTQLAKSPIPSTTSEPKTAAFTASGSNVRRSGTVLRNEKESSIPALSTASAVILRTSIYQDAAEAARAALPVQGVPLP
jgi:hypothetical protein